MVFKAGNKLQQRLLRAPVPRAPPQHLLWGWGREVALVTRQHAADTRSGAGPGQLRSKTRLNPGLGRELDNALQFTAFSWEAGFGSGTARSPPREKAPRVSEVVMSLGSACILPSTKKPPKNHSPTAAHARKLLRTVRMLKCSDTDIFNYQTLMSRTNLIE